MDKFEGSNFPPRYIAGNRVELRAESPRSGTIEALEKPQTMDQLLYTVRWDDDGHVSKHYANELFCIGRFKTRTDFEVAIKPLSSVELTVGPRGGFRHARLQLEYDGCVQETRISDRSLWVECVEPIITKQGLKIVSTKE